MRFKEIIEELEALLTSEGFCSRDEVAWWLLKHEERYIGLSKIKDTLEAEFPDRNLREHKSFIIELLFTELYEGIDKSFENTKPFSKEEVYLNDILNKIKTSTNGLNRKDKNFKWDSNPR
ncbi:hypothetical protein ITJ86_04195 [Winogradskyella sp. F6397]|uniref:Uncharacterized protein n=1 Tax=Winogradskyella marina TaxID=2785530 RepID=A0ABS0EHP1_9FLAO|nr:hypothetical protein [Winogradskyella marina]MBF8149082.1 hypothetical protein [Winogradskyella marina]